VKGKVLPLERVLGLRPTNAVGRLGAHSLLPALNPRDLLAVLPEGAALACFPAYAPWAVPGLLRAARDLDAVLGIACPHPLGEREAPAQLVDQVGREAAAARHQRPLFLQAGPLRLRSTEPAELDAVSSAVWDFVEAGFTLISVDVSALVPRDGGVLAQVVQSATERELGVEVTPPLGDGGRFDAAGATAFLESIVSRGVLPQFLRLPASAYALAPHAREPWELDLSVLEAAREIARAHGAALAVEQDGGAPERLGATLLRAGVRKVDADELCARAALGAWPKDAQEALDQRAQAQGLDRRRLIRPAAPGVQVPAQDQLRSEAAHWAAASDLLTGLRARGTGSLAITRLAEGSRY
jgi:hypothetical protein